MKFKHFLFSLPLIFSLISCNQESVSTSLETSSSSTSIHEHKFTNIINEAYVAKERDVFTGKGYYKSCECGEISDEIFYVGSPLSYQFNNEPKILTTEEFVEVLNISLPSQLLSLFPVTTILKRTFLYESIDQYGERIVLSGSVTFPLDSLTYQPQIDGFIFDHHPTMFDYTESTFYSFTQWSMLVLTGCCVIEIDGRGNGISFKEPAIYHCIHYGNRNFIDGIYSAFSLLSSTYQIETENKKIYNVGYSQGGYDALSFLKYLETEKTSTNFKVDKTFAASGAYNPATEFQFCLNNPSFNRPEIIIMALMSFEYYHSSQFSFSAKDLLTDYGDKFVDALLHKSLEELENLKLETDEYGNSLISSMENVFIPELFDEDNETRQLIIKLGEEESLLKDNWVPKGKCLLFYSETDDLVTPLCSKQAIESFSSAIGKNIEVLSISNKNHIDSAINFYLRTVLDIVSDIRGINLSILYNVISNYL